MNTKTLPEQAKIYLEQRAFLEDCRRRDLDIEATLRDTESARSELIARLREPHSPSIAPLAAAIQTYIDTEIDFDRCGCLPGSAKELEKTRLQLWEQLAEAAETQDSDTSLPPLPLSMRILIATDGSPPSQWAADVGVTMAQKMSAELLLLHVIVPNANFSDEIMVRQEYVRAQERRDAERLIKQVQSDLPESVESKVMIRDGDAAIEIAAAAKEWGADLIVMGTRGGGRLSHFIVGSTAEAVIRRSPCPVVAVSHPAAWASGIKAEAPAGIGVS